VSTLATIKDEINVDRDLRVIDANKFLCRSTHFVCLIHAQFNPLTVLTAASGKEQAVDGGRQSFTIIAVVEFVNLATTS
jgi:hypothetical protein